MIHCSNIKQQSTNVHCDKFCHKEDGTQLLKTLFLLALFNYTSTSILFTLEKAVHWRYSVDFRLSLCSCTQYNYDSFFVCLYL